MRREIAVPFVCSRCGDCCRYPAHVLMTPAERAAIRAVPLQPLSWSPLGDSRFVRLDTGPCPYLKNNGDGTSACVAFEDRPYVCRQFMCGRPEGSAEAFEAEPFRAELGMLGCRNLSERLAQSLRFREHYRTNQKHAQREWADSHGWRAA